jgi:hypothetical protein
VEFVQRGSKFRIVPESAGSIRGRITPMAIVNRAGADLDQSTQELTDALEKEWRKDWADL